MGYVLAYYATGFENKFGEEYIIRTSSDYSKELRQIKEFLFIQVLFFIALNFAIHFFYKNYIKRDFYNKITKMKRFLENGEKGNINYLKEEKWFFEFWNILKEWQSKNLENIERLKSERKTLSLVISSVDIFIGLMNSDGKFIVKNSVLSYLIDHSREKYMECIRYIELIDVMKKGIVEKKNFKEEVYVQALKRYFIVTLKHIDFSGQILVTIKDITSMMKKGIVEKKNFKEEVYVQALKRYFIVTLKHIDFSGQILVTIKDITSTRKAVEVQKSFISNVSHELKTPLTNIKGYLIALEDAPESMRIKFLNVIKGNVERLENIVLDFLNISKIENSNILNMTQVGIDKIKENLETTLEMILKRKNGKIQYEVKVNDENEYIRTDFEKVTMILKNLVENGIIYNSSKTPCVKIKIEEENDRYNFKVSDNGIGIPLGEMILKNLVENGIIYNSSKTPCVKIKIEEENDRYNFKVSDNGIGIPLGEQYKVFDRFYRVDKARTSNLGGTGLGLAIVKNLVEKCGGKISITSEENKGTTFEFYVMK